MNTLSYNLLGKFGRLGNCMFQYASTLGIARKLNRTPTASISQVDHFSDCFKLGSVVDRIIEPNEIYTESSFSFDEKAFRIPEQCQHIEARGYFQTEKYFSHVADEVRDNFSFSDDIKEKAKKYLPDDKTVSIHVRRGDYVHLTEQGFHGALFDYYKKALEYFPNHTPVVFSDEIKWCKDNFDFCPSSTVFVDDDSYDINMSSQRNSDISGYIDMCSMSMCDAHIITNSSFSWWGAYLGQGKTIAPSPWFGPSGPQDFYDVYCQDWTVLNNG